MLSKELCFELCKNNISDWNNLEIEDFMLDSVQGGLTNQLIKFYLSHEKLALTKKDEKLITSVLIRIYGENTENLIDREKEIKLYRYLSEKKLAPKLYSEFAIGRIEEFIEATTLTAQDIRNPEIFTKVARRLASLHNLEIDHISNNPCLFPNLKSWYTLSKQVHFPNDSRKEALLLSLELEDLQQDIDTLQYVIESEEAFPVLFCHHDVQPGNLLFNFKTNHLNIIDYEYADYNYRGVEFGNFFCEWTLINDHPEFPHFIHKPSLYPSIEIQKQFFREYLQEFSKLESTSSKQMKNKKTEDEELEFLIQEAKLFSAVSNLIWGLWAVNQAQHSTVTFGYLEYAASRLKEFSRLREEVEFVAGRKNPLTLKRN